jgi:hypothetical protein
VLREKREKNSLFTMQEPGYNPAVMRSPKFVIPLGVLAVLLFVPVSILAKKLLSDFNMRLHIYQTHWNQNRYGVHAFGRANLFDEKGIPHGVEFTYDCAYHLMASNANESYPAVWKKRGQSIDVAFGEIGSNPNSFHDCEFKIAEKPFVWYQNRGELGTESAQDFLAKRQKQTPTVGAATEADVPKSANPPRL